MKTNEKWGSLIMFKLWVNPFVKFLFVYFLFFVRI
ncbi:MAG: hypothetical protein JWR54_2617 [Mucilaginibacter sp.]|nr:hypothetical protein [Mucilaginibacter sp.]